MYAEINQTPMAAGMYSMYLRIIKFFSFILKK